MKKVSDNKELTSLQEGFYETDGPSGLGSTLVNFERESFYQKTIEDILPEKRLFNKSYGDIFYCKKNEKNETIVPNPKFIKSMNFIKGEHKSLAFVSKAYQNFVTEWNREIEKGAIPEQQNIEIIPLKSYTSFEAEYSKTITEYSLLYSSYLKATNSIEKIKDLKTFIKEISKIVSIETKTNPFTVSKFIESKFCPDTISGMVLELPHRDNEYKTKKQFIESQAFTIFQDIATRNGFVIDKNNPWKLYFNLQSPVSRQIVESFLEEDEKFSKHFYNKFFVSTGQYDFYFFKKYILEMYNFTCTAYPTSIIKESIFCNGKSTIKSNTVNREPIFGEMRDDLLETESELYWWRFFVFVKLCEHNVNINQSQFENLVEQVYSIYETLDEKEAMEYLELSVRSFSRSNNKTRNFSY